MAKKRSVRTMSTQVVTVESILSAKIAELELLECTCETITDEEGIEHVTVCDRCRQIEELSSQCTCGKCDDCLRVLLAYHQSQKCTCTYKDVEVSVPNPETGLEDIIIEKVVDVMCDRCKQIQAIEKQLSDHEIMRKAYIDECNFDKYEVVDGVIQSKVIESGKMSEIDALKQIDSGIMSSTLDLDFRLMMVEDVIESTQPMAATYNLTKTIMKGSVNMTPYQMMYTLILADNYDRADFEYKISVYVRKGRMTQEEADKLIAMMDAKELVQK